MWGFFYFAFFALAFIACAVLLISWMLLSMDLQNVSMSLRNVLNAISLWLVASMSAIFSSCFSVDVS